MQQDAKHGAGSKILMKRGFTRGWEQKDESERMPVRGSVALVLATALVQLRDAGVSADQVIILLASLSGLPPTADLDHLTGAFDLSKMHASAVSIPARWIEDPVEWIP